MPKISLSMLTSYLTCPRLCYYRIHYGESTFSESNAVREIYISLRRGLDMPWAENRARSLYEAFDDEIFRAAAAKFVMSDVLETLKPLDWDVNVRSERLGISMVIDEVVEVSGTTFPLFVSRDAPKKGVWLKDAVKATLACMALQAKEGFIYYAYSGELRSCSVTVTMKRRCLKLIERVRMLAKGFMPERKEGKYCKFCSFAEDCRNEPETFASKFL